MQYRVIAPASETVTDSPKVAETAFRELLERGDLLEEPGAAVALYRDGELFYLSRCDRELGAGRIHPLAPLDLYGPLGDLERVLSWRPACV